MEKSKNSLAQEKLNEIRTLVDLRFGHGTWAGILQERNKRIQEAKQAALEARRQRQKDIEQMQEMIMLGFGVAILVVAAIGIAWLVARG